MKAFTILNEYKYSLKYVLLINQLTVILVCFLVYDITDEDTFKGAKTRVSEIQKKSENCLILLVGNKVDLTMNRKVDIHMVKDFVENNNIIYMESSAKTGLNVDKIFTTIAENIVEEKDQVVIDKVLNIENEGQQARYTQYNCC